MVAAATLAALGMLARTAASGRSAEAALCALLTIIGAALWGMQP